jgi:hypothetical protein
MAPFLPSDAESAGSIDHSTNGRDRDEREIAELEDAIAGVESAIASLADMAGTSSEPATGGTSPEEIRAVVNADRFPLADA